jgi:hypothetical protein
MEKDILLIFRLCSFESGVFASFSVVHYGEILRKIDDTTHEIPFKYVDTLQEPPRKERETSGVFETSRWTPVVMDIMEAVVHERNLDTSHYPFFHAESQVRNIELSLIILLV